MKKIISLGVLVVFLMVGFNSCGKYEEGPAISLRTKTKRIEGEWKVDRVTQEGVDITAQYPEGYITFEEDGNYIKMIDGVSDLGVWELGSEKENIVVSITGTSDIDEYKIIRLKNKEMWLDVVVISQTLRFYLIPK